MFSIFSNLEFAGNDPLYPWLSAMPLYEKCLLIPINILFSIAMGVCIGYVSSKYINWRLALKTDFIWFRVRGMRNVSHTAELVFILLVSCYSIMSLSTRAYIQNSYGVLVVFTICVTVSRFAKSDVTVNIAQGLKAIWLDKLFAYSCIALHTMLKLIAIFSNLIINLNYLLFKCLFRIFAEVILFSLTGTFLSFDSSNGPLNSQRGMSGEMFKNVIIVMCIGSIARFLSVGASMMIIYPTLPPHRKEFRWISRFWVSCFIFQLPKATIQATLGAVAYQNHIIPGTQGQNKALLISQASALSVLMFSTIGCVLSQTLGNSFSAYLSVLDKAAGWRDKDMEARFARFSLTPSSNLEEKLKKKGKPGDDETMVNEKRNEMEEHLVAEEELPVPASPTSGTNSNEHGADAIECDDEAFSDDEDEYVFDDNGAKLNDPDTLIRDLQKTRKSIVKFVKRRKSKLNLKKEESNSKKNIHFDIQNLDLDYDIDGVDSCFEPNTEVIGSPAVRNDDMNRSWFSFL